MTSSIALPTTILAIRPATPDDDAVIARLAGLDSAPRPTGAILVGAADGRPLAALSLDSGAIVADPFSPTAELVAMLRERAARIHAAAAACAPGRRAVVRPAFRRPRRAPGPFTA